MLIVLCFDDYLNGRKRRLVISICYAYVTGILTTDDERQTVNQCVC